MKRNDVPFRPLRVVEKLSDNAAHLHLRSHEVVDPDAQRAPLNRVSDKHLIRSRNPLEFQVLLDEQSDVTRQFASPPKAISSPEEIGLFHFGFVKSLSQASSAWAKPFLSRSLRGLAIMRRATRWRQAEVMAGKRVQHAHTEPEAAMNRDDDGAQSVREREVEIRSVDRDVDGFVHVNGLQRATFLWPRSGTNARSCKFAPSSIRAGKDWLTISIYPVAPVLTSALHWPGVGPFTALSEGFLGHVHRPVPFNGRGEMKGSLA